MLRSIEASYTVLTTSVTARPQRQRSCITLQALDGARLTQAPRRWRRTQRRPCDDGASAAEEYPSRGRRAKGFAPDSAAPASAPAEALRKRNQRRQREEEHPSRWRLANGSAPESAARPSALAVALTVEAPMAPHVQLAAPAKPSPQLALARPMAAASARANKDWP